MKLRFEISAQDHDRLRAMFVAPEPGKVQRNRYLKVYLDTPDALLHRQGTVWCFARKDKFRDSRLKAGDWRLESDDEARAFIKKHRLRDRIGGVFAMRSDQEKLVYRGAQIAVEIMLEQTTLRNGSRLASHFEAQFTLQEGEADQLTQLVSEALPEAHVSAPGGPALIDQGYALSNAKHLASLAGEEAQTSGSGPEKIFDPNKPFDRTMNVAEAFSCIMRVELAHAFAAPAPIDEASVQHNLAAVRRVRTAFRFFAGLFEGAGPELDVGQLADWETALEKVQSLDRALSVYLKPAAKLGRWEYVSSILARLEDSPRRSYTMLAQTWSQAQVQNVYAKASEHIEVYIAAASVNDRGAENLLVFLAQEMPKAIGDIQSLGAFMQQEGMSRAKNMDIHLLARAVARLAAVAHFFEPLTSGKSARRLAALLEVLDELTVLLEREYQSRHALELVADAVGHIGRMRQTKTQTAQIFAAGALTGFIEAQKREKLEKALTKGIAAFSEIKPFWTKIE